MSPDWPKLYADEVAPILAAWAAPTPPRIRALALAALLVGLAVLLLAPWPAALAGLAPLLLVAFGAWAIGDNRRAARRGVVLVRTGTVETLRVERVLTDSTTTGATEAREVHVLTLTVAEEGTLSASGVTLRAGSGSVRLTTSAELHRDLSVGMALVAVSLPTAPAHVHLRVRPDGTAAR